VSEKFIISTTNLFIFSWIWY